VLVLGESGVGKELVARAVHARSAHRERPLVRVNCGAIPRELLPTLAEFKRRERAAGKVRPRRRCRR
jgi:DNA-binding NtrC family response regulator